MMRVELRTGCGREGLSEFRVIKCRRLCSAGALDHYKLTPLRSSNAIPDASVALPDRPHTGATTQRVRGVTHPFFCARIVGCGERGLRIACLLSDGGNSQQENQSSKP